MQTRLRRVETLPLMVFKLDKMGYNIGVRLIEDFLSKSRQTRCKTMTETAEVLKDAFRQYINVTPQVTNWNSEQDAFR